MDQGAGWEGVWTKCGVLCEGAKGDLKFERVGGEIRGGVEPCVLGLVGNGAGRRTPCAGRAVILTAVQSLRLLVRRGACGERGWHGDKAGTALLRWLVRREGLWGEGLTRRCEGRGVAPFQGFGVME